MASGTRVENDSERFSQAIRWSLASGAESNEAVNGVQPLHSFEKRERVASPVANTVTQVGWTLPFELRILQNRGI